MVWLVRKGPHDCDRRLGLDGDVRLGSVARGGGDGPRSIRGEAGPSLLLEGRAHHQDQSRDPIPRRHDVANVADGQGGQSHRLAALGQRDRTGQGCSKTAFLFIAAGRNGGGPPKADDEDELVQKIAAATGTVVVELKMVPNQPLVFHNDGVSRKEDDLIGYTWNQYLTTGDERWPARLPMVKSAVRRDGLRAGTLGQPARRQRAD